MNWKALLGSKKTLYYGVPAVGALGLGAWYYRKRHPATSSSAAAVTDSSSGGGAPAGSAAGQFPDTSGTDVASWLGSQEGQFQSEFTDFLNQSADQQQAFLDKLGTPGAPTSGTGHPVVGVPKPPIEKAPPTGPRLPKPKQSVTVGKFTSTNPPWNSTLSGIAAHEHTTVAALEKLNGNVDPRKLQPGQKIYY